MNKPVVLFLVAFLLGAAGALILRTALHRPYEPTTSPAPAPTPVSDPAATARHTPVNTICPICGMDVDPEIATAEYQGKTIGFGCGACPPKFAANPDKYGPFALQNKEAE